MSKQIYGDPVSSTSSYSAEPSSVGSPHSSESSYYNYEQPTPRIRTNEDKKAFKELLESIDRHAQDPNRIKISDKELEKEIRKYREKRRKSLCTHI